MVQTGERPGGLAEATVFHDSGKGFELAGVEHGERTEWELLWQPSLKKLLSEPTLN